MPDALRWSRCHNERNKCTVSVTCSSHRETISPSLVPGNIVFHKTAAKKVGDAALDNACIQLQGLVRAIDEAPEKRHQGDGRETQRGMSVTEPAGGVSKRKWSGCEVVPVEKRMQIRSFWLLFNQQFKQHGRIGP